MKKGFWCLLGLCLFFVGCHQKNEASIRVAATPTPQAEILREVAPDLKKKGVHLEIIEVEDYISPNRLLQERQVDANFFQHRPYLKIEEDQFGYDFEELVAVHLEPMGIYSAKHKDLDHLPPRIKVTIPSDPSNQARALLLLQDAGLIRLGNSSMPTLTDVIMDPLHIHFWELESPFLPRSLHDVDLSVIPSNFALQARLNPLKDALFVEPPDSPYVNVVVIRRGEKNEKLELLAEELKTPKTRHFLTERYQGALIPAYQN